MKLSWAARRRWALVLLLVGLPVYIVAAVTIMNRLDRPGILVELVIYVALGVLWALPFRFVFLGVGRPDSPEAIGAAIFPLSSPFAMIARAAEQEALWPHFVALAWQALWVALIIKGASAIFRRSVLKSGPAFRWPWQRKDRLA